MQFPKSNLRCTLDEFFSTLDQRLSNKTTLVFLDTNVLSFCYKLHKSARTELYNWFEELQSENRLCVPSWVIHEYTNKFKEQKLSEYAGEGRDPEKLVKQAEGLYKDASMFFDDASLANSEYKTRGDYLHAFRKSVDDLKKVLAVFKRDLDVYGVHDGLAQCLESAVLASDIESLLYQATKAGDARYNHRVPPGFDDGTKPLNKFGDLIIWNEIAARCKDATGFEHAVLITNDKKRDWVYTPQWREHVQLPNRKNVPNTKPVIHVADPRLVSEFKTKCSDMSISIVTLDLAIEALSKGAPNKFGSVSQAVQIDVELTPASVVTSAEITNVGTEASEKITVQASAPYLGPTSIDPKTNALVIGENAKQDASYDLNDASTINSIIKDLKSQNWYTQNPAITRLVELYPTEQSREAWFVLGRNIYQSACGNATKAMNFIGSIEYYLGRFGNIAANSILAGMIFEVYFDSNGKFRDHKKTRFIDPLFTLVNNERFTICFDFIRTQLLPHRESLVYLVGDEKPVELVVHLQPTATLGDASKVGEIISVRLNGVELLADEVKSNPFSTDDQKIEITEIKRRICIGYALPSSLVSVLVLPENAGNAAMKLPSGKGLNIPQWL
jgi:hypothetical protein